MGNLIEDKEKQQLMKINIQDLPNIIIIIIRINYRFSNINSLKFPIKTSKQTVKKYIFIL